jgi:hypothetical protein
LGRLTETKGRSRAGSAEYWAGSKTKGAGAGAGEVWRLAHKVVGPGPIYVWASPAFQRGGAGPKFGPGARAGNSTSVDCGVHCAEVIELFTV